MTFVNLPLRHVTERPEHVELFLARGLNPELGLDAQVLDCCSPAWHREQARVFHEAGLTCAVHLPFFDIHPGSLDRLARHVCVERLLQAVDVAQTYAPAHYFAHLDYRHGTYGRHQDAWRSRVVETWNRILDHTGDVPLFLENVYEDTPRHHVEVLRALGGRARMCLDVGHWHSFARGYERGDLGLWLDTLGGLISHLHLHDNDGSADQHLGLGQGNIPWDLLWAWLKSSDTPITATFEPHTETDFRTILSYLRNHPELNLDFPDK